MKEISKRIRNVLFWMLIALFTALVIDIYGRFVELPIIVLGSAFGLLGLTLVLLTVRQKEPRAQKAFFILTGASAAGFLIAAVLHNVVYGLFIHWFGKDFWGGGDEAVFFLLALLVCPALFLIGVVGSVGFWIREKSRGAP